jgi:transposase-like protein
MTSPYAIEPPDMSPPDDPVGPECPECHAEDCIVRNPKGGTHRGKRWYKFSAECPTCGHQWEEENLA